MADVLLPPWLNISRVAFSLREFVGVSASPFNGITRTGSLDGHRLGASLEFTPSGGAGTPMERAALIAFQTLCGKRNRALLYDPSNRIRGSFPGTELLSNNTFDSGTTGWTNAGSPATLSVADRVMRVTRTSSGINPQMRQAVTVSEFVPYAVRAMLINGRGTQTLYGYMDNNGSIANQTLGPGLATVSMVAPGTTLTAVAYDASLSGAIAGDYFEVPYMSLSRCALVDGGINLLARSDEFNDAIWVKSAATITANAIVAPDGQSTADDLFDTTANSVHFVAQTFTVSSAANDIQFSVAVKARNRGWCSLEFSDGANTARCTFDVTNGANGVNGGTGASWANRRQFIQPLGNGWYSVTMVVRKTVAATSITARVYAANGDGVETYAGSGNAAIALWRATISVSGVPARLKQASSTNSPSSEAQRGSGLHLKGLPVSTNGLLLTGDMVEIIGGRGSELHIVTAALNSDASGLGYLQFEPQIRSSPADNAAVIVRQPMGRFIFAGDSAGWQTEPGIITSASAEFVEA